MFTKGLQWTPRSANHVVRVETSRTGTTAFSESLIARRLNCVSVIFSVCIRACTPNESRSAARYAYATARGSVYVISRVEAKVNPETTNDDGWMTSRVVPGVY